MPVPDEKSTKTNNFFKEPRPELPEMLISREGSAGIVNFIN